MDKGEHSVSWNNRMMPAGYYFLQLTAGQRQVIRKITVLE
jgi:hypothetical protein